MTFVSNAKPLKETNDRLTSDMTESSTASAAQSDRLGFIERESDIIGRGVPMFLGHRLHS
jgi:hypothetical protein